MTLPMLVANQALPHHNITKAMKAKQEHTQKINNPKYLEFFHHSRMDPIASPSKLFYQNPNLRSKRTWRFQ